MEALAVLGGIIIGLSLVIVLLEDRQKPKFYKLNEKMKKAEKKVRKGRVFNLDKLKNTTENAFKAGKIDGMERDFLYQRIKVVENLILAKLKPSGPKYAAGGPEDRI